MELRETIEDDVVILELVENFLGETDGVVLIDAVNDYIADGYINFVIDMRDLEHINSAGLGILITANEKVRKAGGKMLLTHLNDRNIKLFKVTKLEHVFTILANIKDALKLFND